MDVLNPDPELARAELRALSCIGRAARNGLEQPQRALLDALQRVVLHTALDVDELPPITAAELATADCDAAQARQLIRLGVALSVADGPPSTAQVAMLSEFAAALGVNEPAVDVIGHLAKGRLLRFRLAFMRHSHVRIYLRNTRRLLGGVRPLIRALLVARGVAAENTELASRFRAMEKLPADSLGHHFFQHCQREGLAFAGQKGGFPVGALFHDFTHVLAGYDTSPEGEMKNAAFQAGYCQDPDDFFTMLFALVIHTAGVNMTPFEMPVLLGRIGEGKLATEVLLGWQRGAAVKVDLGRDWDFWEYVELPIEVARERLGIPPLQAA